MSNLIRSQVEAKIRSFKFSDNSDVLQRSSSIIVKNQNVGFSLDISNIDINEANKIRESLTTSLMEIQNIGKINIVLTKEETALQSEKKITKITLESIKKIILIASGKGGVGKSTIASLLAQKLAHQGKKIGLLDADIYGPSIPSIFNIQDHPLIDNQKMLPLYKHMVKINSIGFISNTSSAISFRGPMASKALDQLILLTKWGDLDYLIIDTPPGTGDIHLSLLQNYIISGVIMITTPQKISAVDVTRAINLYQKFNIPILGIIENMSYYKNLHSQEKIHILSGNAGEQIANDFGIPLLNKIPLDEKLSQDCDFGNLLERYFHFLQFEV